MKTNITYFNDNLQIMKNLPSESIDLIYLDPPYFTQKDFIEFDDRFKDINYYLEWMTPRLQEMHRILKPTGSIYLHVDYHAAHYLKVKMDEIFGYINFQTEIIWKRKNQSRKESYGHNHDMILYYTKSKEYVFNTQTRNKIVDSPTLYNGKPCKTAPASGYSKSKQKEMLKNGSAYLTKNGKIRQVTYLTVYKGKAIDIIPCDNIWIDIPNMMHTPKSERLGYPTQKPEALLERIIKVSK
jgi:site-specific DNA-methyltransferase (adenine-specific)